MFHAVADAGAGFGDLLIVSDGTAAGTFALTSPPLGVGISRPRWITPAAGGVFFAPAYVNQDEDRELYFSDGTLLGTSVVCDLEPGSASSDPTDLVLLDGDVVFAANVASSVGDELWRATPAGAYVADLGITGAGHVIHATQPLLGTTAVVRGEGGPSAKLLFLGLGAPLPAPSALLVAPGSAAWLDPLTALILHVSATPTWSFAIAIPTSPALAGLPLVLQSWTPGAITPFPASTSNGLLLVLGS